MLSQSGLRLDIKEFGVEQRDDVLLVMHGTWF